MINGLNHAGIVVNNLEDSIKFYSNVIGLPVARMIERKGSPISAVVGYDDVHIKAALLDLGDGHFLELIQYFNPIASDRPTNERAVLGGSHLAFNVDNHVPRHGVLDFFLLIWHIIHLVICKTLHVQGQELYP